MDGKRHEAFSLFVYGDRTFTVGGCSTPSPAAFKDFTDAYVRAQALIDGLGLAPKVWKRRA